MDRFAEKRSGKFLLVQVTRKKSHSGKLGITASRKFGCAVVRNRFKRKIREIYRHLPKAPHDSPLKLWIHVKPRPLAEEVSFEELKKEFLELLR